MFTGIVQRTAIVTEAKAKGSVRMISVASPSGWKLSKGQSIAVDGVCVTVTGTKRGTFSFDCMPVTLKKTTARAWEKGRVVNLERALRQKDLLDGHLIQGHVDGRARVALVKQEGKSKMIALALPKPFLKNVALHGSLTVNGVSLTVSRLTKGVATVSLIPYTLAHTNLDALEKGDEVNIETDFLARHLLRRGGRVGTNAKRGTR